MVRCILLFCENIELVCWYVRFGILLKINFFYWFFGLFFVGIIFYFVCCFIDVFEDEGDDDEDFGKENCKISFFVLF